MSSNARTALLTCITEVETINTPDYDYMWLYVGRPMSVSADLSHGLG